MNPDHNNALKTIAIIDDDESITSFLAFSLKQEGFNVVTGRGAESFKKVLGGQIPDLMLLDVMLPNIDGFSFCEQLRKDAKFNKMPILFITAYANKQTVNLKRTQDVGGQGFIEKPIMFDELLSQVMDALEGRFSVPTRLKFAA